MMSRHIAWHGTADEAVALLHALSHNCACKIVDGRTIAPCSGHRMLALDQRAIDGLVFVRRIAERLLAEEFGVSPTALVLLQ